jgi:hypothetical protein
MVARRVCLMAPRILRRFCTTIITPYRLDAPSTSASDATRGATHTRKNHAVPNKLAPHWHLDDHTRTGVAIEVSVNELMTVPPARLHV